MEMKNFILLNTNNDENLKQVQVDGKFTFKQPLLFMNCFQLSKLYDFRNKK